MSQGTGRSRLSKGTLIVGFAALFVGVRSASGDAATGYELSIYTGTPATFWAGIAVALAASLVVTVAHTERGPLRDAGLSLGGVSMISVVALPLVRGYYQFGGGDSLTHLGWTRDIVAGRLDPVDMLYPGIHTTTVFTSELLGTRLGRSQLFVTAAFVGVFFLFVPKCVGLVGDRRWAVPVGAFSAFLLLPNNNVSVHLMAHPITQSLLFLPFVLYLALLYVSRAGASADWRTFTAPGAVLLTLSFAALVLLHPQGALNVVAVFVAISLVQFLFRRFRDGSRVSDHRPLYVPTAAAVLAFALWAPRHPRVQRTVDTVVTSLLQGSTPADEITQRSVSLGALGGDISELFAKLFLPSTVFCLLTAALVVAWCVGRFDGRDADRGAFLTYFVVSLVPLSGAFAVFFAASMTTQHFRYVGFVMVPITILGAAAVSLGAGRLDLSLGERRVQLCLVVVFLLLLPLPLATVHSSPFIYQPTADVTQTELSGTDAAVEYGDRDVAFAGIRSGPRRQLHGTQGTVGTEQLGLAGERDAIPETVFRSNVTTHYDSPRYVPVSSSDYQREVGLYDGLRYPESGFERLRTGTGVDRVHTNGGYRLYRLGNESGS